MAVKLLIPTLFWIKFVETSTIVSNGVVKIKGVVSFVTCFPIIIFYLVMVYDWKYFKRKRRNRLWYFLLKSKDEDTINRALLTSAMVAFDMQDASVNALYYIDKLIELGNKNLYSDLICSAILLSSCNEMASLNVLANVKGLKNETIKQEYIEKSEKSVKKSKLLKNKVIRMLKK